MQMEKKLSVVLIKEFLKEHYKFFLALHHPFLLNDNVTTHKKKHALKKTTLFLTLSWKGWQE